MSRRGFLETAGAATGALVAAGTFAHPAIGKVKGANERINFAILGPGGRAQAHIGHLLDMKKEGKAVDIIGVCDVWDGRTKDADGKGSAAASIRRPSAAASTPTTRSTSPRTTASSSTTRTSTRSCIATPDHWHAKMSIDAMEAGKDVYCEKPMTHTIDEARRSSRRQARTKQVMTVGVQSMADPTWQMANELITAGNIGHVVQGQTSYYRNSASASGGTTR